jgi:hypothetical protein
MKLHALGASAVALALALTSHAAAGDKLNSDFVALAVISYAVSQKCPAYDFVDGGARLAADQQGVDFDTYGPATLAAIFAIMGNDYDRSKLIPAVTRQVRSDLTELLGEIGNGVPYFGKKYGAVMANVGFMKKR